jgi:antitoxin YqcF
VELPTKTSGGDRAPETGRAAARAAIAAFGGEPEIYKYGDEDEGHKVDILSCKDRPNPGLTSYSTLGVHLMPNLIDNDDFRVELAGIAESKVEEFPNLLAMAALYVIKNRWHVAKGIVFPGLLNQYKISGTMHHLMWMEPLEWNTLASVDVGGGLTVHWVLAFPISESERQYLMDNGFWKLESLMVDREVEYWDLNRRPVA